MTVAEGRNQKPVRIRSRFPADRRFVILVIDEHLWPALPGGIGESESRGMSAKKRF